MKIIIGTVPSRIEYHSYLKKKLPNAIWIFDHNRDGAMSTYKKKLVKLQNECGLILEDDVIFADNFMTKIEHEISKRPNDFINFFSMRKADFEIGSRYYSDFIGNLCVYIPKNHSNKILDWHEQYWVPANYEGNMSTSATDLFLRSYLKANKIKCWLVVPNLVNHRVGKSVIDPRRSSKRLSKTFIGPTDEEIK
tara:strand:- start:2714 stop:3295 length:582 start_codon:yes stop_codon:yes gene_type:complete